LISIANRRGKKEPHHADLKAAYIGWARKTAEGLRGANASLEKQFDEAALAAERSLVPPGGL